MVIKHSILEYLDKLNEDIIELRLNIQNDNEDFICETCMETLNWLHDVNGYIKHLIEFIKKEL